MPSNDIPPSLIEATKRPNNQPAEGPKLPNDSPPDPIQATADAAKEIIRIEDAIQALPEDKRLIALLGITKPLTIRKLPEPYRAITISLPRKNLEAMRSLLKDMAIQCNSDFIGPTEDELVSLAYIIPHPDNIHHILSRAKTGRIPAKIAVAEDSTLILRAQGSPILSVHKLLDDETAKYAETPLVPSATLIDNSGHQKAMQELSGEALGATSLTQFDVTYASPASLQEAESSTITHPRQGTCTYLMIDQNLLESQNPADTRVTKLLEELELYVKSPDFHITGYNGFLVIVATAERGGSSLKAMSARIYKTIPFARIFIGKGALKYHGPDNFSIEGFPSTARRQEMTSYPQGVYITPELTTGRDASLDVVETRPVKGSEFLRLTSFRAKVSLHVGGPDRLIGFEDHLDVMREALTDNKTKLTILKGRAGMGKSRLLDASLKELPASVTCSLDPSGKNIPGFGLMTTAEQIFTHIKEDPALTSHPEARELRDFDAKPQKEKIKAVQQNPKQITEACFKALQLLNRGKTPLYLDDIHHADRFSMPLLIGLASRYMTETNGKVVLAMRPEEMYKPQDLTTLTQSIGRIGAVKEMEVQGLNFHEGETARAFAYYSLPPALREGKTLGPWYQELGRIAGNSPFVMKTLMDGILEDPERNLVVSGEIILLREEALARIKRVTTASDLGIYYTERLRKLPPASLKSLQCIALMGGSVSAAQIEKIAKRITKTRSTEELRAAIVPLIKGGYLIQEGGIAEEQEGAQSFRLQHETINDIAVASIATHEEKLELAIGLYNLFKRDQTVHTDIRFSLAHNVASDETPPAAEMPFWGEYQDITEACLQSAKKDNAIGRGYGIAKTILDRTTGSRTIRNAIEDLKAGRRVEQVLQQTAIAALINLAENAIFLGKFDEVDKIVETLETIHAKTPELVNIGQAYLLLFNKAYIQADAAEMKKVYEEKLQNGAVLDVPTKIIAEIKLAYREGRMADAERIYSENSVPLAALNRQHRTKHSNMPHPDYIEALRLVHIRIPFEDNREKIRRRDGKMIDDDILMQPGAPTSPQMHTIFSVKNSLDDLLQIRTQHPLAFNPYAELALIEENAQINAFLGRYDRALELFGETWRQATQMEVHPQAARAAKLKGDIYVLQGVSIVEEFPVPGGHGKTSARKVIDRASILKAIQTYSEEGMISLAHIAPNNFYQAAMRIQRIRAIGILCDSYANELAPTADDFKKAQTREELSAYIQKAIEDFVHINKMYGTLITETPALKTTDPARYEKRQKWAAEVSYYLMSYIGHVIAAAKKLNIPIPANVLDEANSPFMRKDVIFLGGMFDSATFDNGIGEKARKQAGFRALEAQMQL